MRVTIEEIEHDSSHELGVDPGLVKDGVEAHLQELLADHVELLGSGYTLVRREYMTPIGPVDLLCRDESGASVAVEIKRRGEIDGVEQLTRYLELLNRDSLLAPVSGVFAAQQIKPQARTLAVTGESVVVTLDYDQMRGIERNGPAVLTPVRKLVRWHVRTFATFPRKAPYRSAPIPRRRVEPDPTTTLRRTFRPRRPSLRSLPVPRLRCRNPYRHGTCSRWPADVGRSTPFEDRRHWHTTCSGAPATSPTRKSSWRKW